MNESKGVLYISMGKDYIKESIVSAESLRSVMPETHITIITDTKPKTDIFDNIVLKKNPAGGFIDKIKYIAETPYEKTIFLDTDTYVIQDISEIYRLLDKFDIAISQNNDHSCREAIEFGSIPRSFPEYNTGVIAYRKSQMKRLSTKWEKAYDATHPHDQPSFRKAAYESKLRLATLPPEYNCLFRYPGHVVGPVKILHGRLISFDSRGAGKYYDVETAALRINSTGGSRVFVPLSTGGFLIYPSQTPLRKIRLSIKERGIFGTIIHGFKKLTD